VLVVEPKRIVTSGGIGVDGRIILTFIYKVDLVVRDSVTTMASRCRLDGPGSGYRVSLWVRFPSPFQIGHRDHPMGASSFPGIKRPERDIKQLRLSGAEVKESVELYFYSPLRALIAGYRVNFTFE
jgi:hypothetical protein